MCILCIEIEKERLLPREAFRNYIEIADSLKEHAEEAAEVVFEYLQEKKYCVWCDTTECDCDNNDKWSIM
jgi:hypothetical protein